MTMMSCAPEGPDLIWRPLRNEHGFIQFGALVGLDGDVLVIAFDKDEGWIAAYGRQEALLTVLDDQFCEMHEAQRGSFIGWCKNVGTEPAGRVWHCKTGVDPARELEVYETQVGGSVATVVSDVVNGERRFTSWLLMDGRLSQAGRDSYSSLPAAKLAALSAALGRLC